MTDIKKFDILNSPLEGVNLIEASAGTGKTYTVTGLFLRLILEKGIPVEKILVVTFTEAATQELKARIQAMLRETLHAFIAGKSDDSFLQDMVKKHGETIDDLKKCVTILKDAIRSFDLAAIYTIHGFCMRMLQDNAFESSSLFDTELIPDQAALKGEIIEDFWRNRFYDTSLLFAGYAVSNKYDPVNLLSFISDAVIHQDITIIPKTHIPDSTEQEQKFVTSFDVLSKAWPSARSEIETILVSDTGLKKTTYKKTSIPLWLSDMDEYAASNQTGPDLFDTFEKFTSRSLAASVKKGCSTPVHPFFECCDAHKKNHEELIAVFDQKAIGLKVELLNYVRKELEHRKKDKNIYSFDDLLLNLNTALNEKNGKNLSNNIQTQFSAALIDEFQDTDQIQYSIFSKIFTPPKSMLFFIGDPKQAIYGFRGADIFTYMNAARQAESRYTLKENWRSEKNLVKAVNTLFQNTDHPFVFNDIPFYPVSPAKKDCSELKINGNAEPPLPLWFMNSDNTGNDNTPVSKENAREVITRSVAAEISRLVNLGKTGQATVGNRALKEGDIAVLVRRNTEAQRVQEALLHLNIAGVLYSSGNLFDSAQALETRRVLAAVVFFNNENLIKIALSTDMIGFSGEKLEHLTDDDESWESWLSTFKKLHDLWKTHGFIRMFNHLIHEQNILVRFMAFPDGERRCTNMLHLGEVLHQISIEKKAGMEGLLKWLSEQTAPDTKRLEEYQIRLESDENAVKIVTMHKSKGLEYPVVFCPFTWDGSTISKKKNRFLFHDTLDHMRPILDIGSKDMDKNRATAEKELLAENMRLLYVALTRAKNRCYLVWGRFKGAGTSAPAFLLHSPEDATGENAVKKTAEKLKALSNPDMIRELKVISDKSGGTVCLSEMPLEAGQTALSSRFENTRLACRHFSGKIDHNWQISSFSSLLSGHHEDRITGLHDGYNKIKCESPDNIYDIFSFPKGAKPGTFLHDIFEHLDFSEKDPLHMEQLVAEKLETYGFDHAFRQSICAMIKNVTTIPLDSSQTDVSLEKIRPRDRLNELEFYFPLNFTTPKRLSAFFAGFEGQGFSTEFSDRMDKLDFSPAKGFMKGFIDLVFKYNNRFYIVDWKSNFLGNKIKNYDQPAMAAAMEKEFYILQYHIYTVALNQYLKNRIRDYSYENNFGGIFYIFLRGVDPGKSSDFGIFRDRPPEKLIDALTTELIPCIRTNRP